MELTKHQYVSLKTTLPVFPHGAARACSQPITTPRLILRPLEETDLSSFFALRSVPEVMTFTSQGVPDADLEATKKVFARFLPPNDDDTYNLAICERDTGRFVGVGGNLGRQGELGWPGVGYAFFPEVWGRGYGTEFLKAFMEHWWELEREEAVVRAESMTLQGLGRELVEGEEGREMIVAVVQDRNAASGRVLKKAGFEQVAEWIAEDLRGSGLVRLLVFACARPE